MQDGCKVYMDFSMTSNGSSFMVTWSPFQNHLLEIDLTQNQETMALRILTTVDSLYYILGNLPSTVGYRPKYNICNYSSSAVLPLFGVSITQRLGI